MDMKSDIIRLQSQLSRDPTPSPDLLIPPTLNSESVDVIETKPVQDSIKVETPITAAIKSKSLSVTPSVKDE